MGTQLRGMRRIERELDDMEDSFGDRVVAQIGTNVEYAPHVEFGTGPHEITGDPLVFEGRDGELVFTDRVMHPGTPAQPFMRPAGRRTRANLQRFLRQSNSVEELVIRAAAYAERQAKRLCPVDTGNLRNSIEWELVL